MQLSSDLAWFVCLKKRENPQNPQMVIPVFYEGSSECVHLRQKTMSQSTF